MTLCVRALPSRPTLEGTLHISLLVTSCHSISLIIFMNILHTMAYLVTRHQPSSSRTARETQEIWPAACSIRRQSSYRTKSILNDTPSVWIAMALWKKDMSEPDFRDAILERLSNREHSNRDCTIDGPSCRRQPVIEVADSIQSCQQTHSISINL
jgi:hypothetical protein